MQCCISFPQPPRDWHSHRGCPVKATVYLHNSQGRHLGNAWGDSSATGSAHLNTVEWCGAEEQRRQPVEQPLVGSGDWFVTCPQGLHMIPQLGLGPQGALPDCGHGSAHPAPFWLLTPHSLHGLCADRHSVGPLGQCLSSMHAAVRAGFVSRTGNPNRDSWQAQQMNSNRGIVHGECGNKLCTKAKVAVSYGHIQNSAGWGLIYSSAGLRVIFSMLLHFSMSHTLGCSLCLSIIHVHLAKCILDK